MSNQNSIIDECLQLLEQSNSPIKNMLWLKTQLNQIKVLLNDPFNEIKCGFFAKDKFEDLLSQMRRACGENYDVDAISQLIGSTGAILILVSGESATGK